MLSQSQNCVVDKRKSVNLSSVIDNRIRFPSLLWSVEMVDSERYFLAGDIHVLERVNKIVPRKFELPLLLKSSWVSNGCPQQPINFFGFKDQLSFVTFFLWMCFGCRYVNSRVWRSTWRRESNISENVFKKNVLNFQFKSFLFSSLCSAGIQIKKNDFGIKSRLFEHLRSYDYKFKSLGKFEVLG